MNLNYLIIRIFILRNIIINSTNEPTYSQQLTKIYSKNYNYYESKKKSQTKKVKVKKEKKDSEKGKSYKYYLNKLF